MKSNTVNFKNLNLSYIERRENKKLVGAALKQYELLKSQRVDMDYDKAIKITEEIVSDKKGMDIINEWNKLSSVVTNYIYVRTSSNFNGIYTPFNMVDDKLRPLFTIDEVKLDNIELNASLFTILINLIKEKNVSHNEIDELYNLLDDDIYDIFCARINAVENKRKRTYNITQIKKQMYYFFFNEGIIVKGGPIKNVLLHDFPLILNIIYTLRKKCRESKQYDEPYKALGYLLKNIEADIFNEVALKHTEEGCLVDQNRIWFKPELRDKILNSLEESLEKYGVKKYKLNYEKTI